MVLGEMEEERVRETRDDKFNYAAVLNLFNPQFLYLTVAVVNYYHINSD